MVYNLPDCLANEWHKEKDPLQNDPEIWMQDPLLAKKREDLLRKQAALKSVQIKMDAVRTWITNAKSKVNTN